jgi:tRNA modification GTPase
MTLLDQDTIAALATPPGKGGVGIIRISGNKAREIGESITRQTMKPRFAHYGGFYETGDSEVSENIMLDQGICLFFPNPHSFTGEDVVELQGHGGPIIMDCLLKTIIKLGARLARPGEFSERAFLNDKIDLAQAEAIADLIDSASEQAARSALRSLQGEFSRHIHDLVEQVIQLRIYVEAAIDFPEEEIDFLSDGHVSTQLQKIIDQLAQVFKQAKQGTLLREGMTVVIAGRPNAGKSSLMNALAGYDAAIVTSIEGTTRDVLREHIQIDGMPLHLIDTAGLRESPDEVEQEGIRRAWQEIEKADRILMMVDSQQTVANDPEHIWPEFAARIPDQSKITLLHNKCDLSGITPGLDQSGEYDIIALSAKQNIAMDTLKDYLKHCMGYNSNPEGSFTARRRHLDALEDAQTALLTGQEQLQGAGAGELLAEDLRACQQSLNEITGEFSSDDLLGRIFTSFCIGK